MTYYIQALSRRWITFVAVAAVIAVASSLAAFLLPVRYTAGVTIYVSTQAGLTGDSAYQGTLLSQQRVKSYTDLVTSPRVLNTVANEVSPRFSPEALADKVTSSSSQDSVLIDITATDGDPATAANIANSVAGTFAGLVAELERPTGRNGVAPVVARPVQLAPLPSAPSSVSFLTVVSAGVMLGLALGAACAIVRDSLDRKIRTTSEIEGITERAHLGSVHEVEGSGDTLGNPSAPEGARLREDIRLIRTKLQYLDIDRHPRIIGVTSSVPGEGKTSLTLGLAEALVQSGHSVLVVDADLRRPNVSNRLGIANDVGLTTVISGRCDLPSAIQDGRGYAVLASGELPPNPGEILGSEQVAHLVERLRSNFDFVLIDTAPLLPVADTVSLAPRLDGLLLLVKWGHVSSVELQQSTALLNAVNARVLGTVATRVPTDATSERRYGYSSYIGAGSHISATSSSSAERAPRRARHTADAPEVGMRGPAASDVDDSATVSHNYLGGNVGRQ